MLAIAPVRDVNWSGVPKGSRGVFIYRLPVAAFEGARLIARAQTQVLMHMVNGWTLDCEHHIFTESSNVMAVRSTPQVLWQSCS